MTLISDLGFVSLGRAQRAFNGPFLLGSTQSGPDDFFRNASLTGEFRERQFSSAIFNENIRDPVVCLLSSCRPSTIARFIVPIVISSVKRMFGTWFLAHVSKEVLEQTPPFAHRDPAAAIEFRGRIRWVVASLFHAGPCAIFRSATLSVRAAHAAARCWVPPIKKIGTQKTFFATYTPAQPQGVSFFRGAFQRSLALHNGPITKDLSSKIFETATARVCGQWILYATTRIWIPRIQLLQRETMVSVADTAAPPACAPDPLRVYGPIIKADRSPISVNAARNIFMIVVRHNFPFSVRRRV